MSLNVQKLNYLNAFHLFDKNHGGIISIEKLKEFLNKLNLFPNENDLKQMIKSFNENNKNFIDFETFEEKMKKYEEIDEENELINFFKIFDKKNNGKINKKDLFNILKYFSDETLTNKEIEEIIFELDEDFDDFINYEKIIKILKEKNNFK
jgi:Ca2+-binding EF-hand superfamily protein